MSGEERLSVGWSAGPGAPGAQLADGPTTSRTGDHRFRVARRHPGQGPRSSGPGAPQDVPPQDPRVKWVLGRRGGSPTRDGHPRLLDPSDSSTSLGGDEGTHRTGNWVREWGLSFRRQWGQRMRTFDSISSVQVGGPSTLYLGPTCVSCVQVSEVSTHIWSW